MVPIYPVPILGWATVSYCIRAPEDQRVCECVYSKCTLSLRQRALTHTRTHVRTYVRALEIDKEKEQKIQELHARMRYEASLRVLRLLDEYSF